MKLPSFDPTRHYLGRLCKNSHEWETTGKTLRNKSKRMCVLCDLQRLRAFEAADPERARSLNRARHLKRHFGISAEHYEAMLSEQGGQCAICGSEPNGKRLAVDHCHDNQRVRGLLCSDCNTAIGLLGDSPARLRNAIAYLEGRNLPHLL